MTLPPGVVTDFVRRQRDLLDRYYLEAWKRGVDAYGPDEDPPAGHTDSSHADVVAAAGQGVLAATIARRHQPYVKPANPNEDRRRATLAAAYRSLDKMAGEIVAVGLSPALAPTGAHETSPAAVDQWAQSNAYRLVGGVGAAVWGGEQAGFAQAAAADGQLLIWICQEDDASCPDCLEMADLPAAPEENWPTLPGGGGTACNGNCRCTMDYAPPGYNG